MQIYIAGPLFNGPQIAILEQIEQHCENNSIGYYSPRLHSGSHLLSPEDKKDFDKWTPVFEENARAVEKSDLVLAVLSYAMPEDQSLQICKGVPAYNNEQDFLAKIQNGWNWDPKTIIHLPDSGTVWEMGAAHALQIPVIGYFLEAPKQLNLMLSHCCEGLLVGDEKLKEWFNSYCDMPGISVHERFEHIHYHNMRGEIE